MKVLVIKPFSMPQDLRKVVDAVYEEHDHEVLDLLFVDYCMDEKFAVENVAEFQMEPSKEDRSIRVRNDKERIIYDKLEFTETGKHHQMYVGLSQEYDVIVPMEGVEMTLEKGFLNRLLEPLKDEQIRMTYSDFGVRQGDITVPYCHISAPSPLKNYPVFAFKGVINESAPNIPELIAAQVLSYHIPHRLVIVHEESR